MHPKPYSTYLPLPWAQQEEAGRRNGVETRDKFLDANVGRRVLWMTFCLTGTEVDAVCVSRLPSSVCLCIVCSCCLLRASAGIWAVSHLDAPGSQETLLAA